MVQLLGDHIEQGKVAALPKVQGFLRIWCLRTHSAVAGTLLLDTMTPKYSALCTKPYD